MKKLTILFLICIISNYVNAQLYAPEIKVQEMTGNSIGIKTANPSTDADLHIKDSRASLFIENTNPSNWVFLRLKGSSSNLWDIAQFGNNDYLEFRPNSSNNNRMILRQNGNLGIKTVPNSNIDLHVKDERATICIENTNSSDWAFLRIKGTGSNLWDIAQFGNNDYLEFRPNSSSTNRIIFQQNGTVKATTFSATSPPWADFVFEDNYILKDLYEVENFILTNKHLPDIPSEKELKKEGLDLPIMDAKLLQKIEELTLYLIEQNKQIQKMQQKIIQLESKIN